MTMFDQQAALKSMLRERLGSRRFKIILKSARIRLETSDTLVIEADTPALAAWLDLHMRDDIESAAAQALGQPVTVSFVAQALAA